MVCEPSRHYGLLNSNRGPYFNVHDAKDSCLAVQLELDLRIGKMGTHQQYPVLARSPQSATAKPFPVLHEEKLVSGHPLRAGKTPGEPWIDAYDASREQVREGKHILPTDLYV